MKSILLLVTLFATTPTTPPAQTVAVDLVAGAAAPPGGGGRLVRGYAWLPAGFLPRGAHDLRLEDGRVPLPTGHAVVARHPDGSARAVQLFGAVKEQRLRVGGWLAVGRGRVPAAAPGIRVTDAGDVVWVDNGVFRIGFARRGESLLLGGESAGSAWIDARRAACITAGLEFDRLSSEWEDERSVRVSKRPLRCLVVQSGALADRNGEPCAWYELEWRVQPGCALLEAVLGVVGGTDLGIAEDLQLDLPLVPRAFVEIVGGDGARYPLRQGRIEVTSADGIAVVAQAGSDRLLLDTAQRGGLRLRGGGASVALVASRLRPNAPRAVIATPSGTLSLAAYAGPFFLDEGFLCRCDFALAIGADRQVSAVEPALRAEPIPSLRGLPATATGAAGAVDLDAAGARLLAALDRGLDAVAGQRDYGDYRLGDGFANLEYDPVAGMLASYVRHGDARHAMLARDMLRHFVVHDLSQGEAGTPAGFPWMHGREHRSLEIEAGHVWAAGLLLGAEVFGDRELRGAVGSLRRAVLQVAASPTSLSNERSFGWLILALADLHEFEPRRELFDALVAVRQELLRRHSARGFFAVDRRAGGGELAPVPWVIGGITMEALYRAERIAPGEGGVAALARLAWFLLSDARHADGSFAARLVYSPELTGKLEASGRASPVDELLIAAGLGRAALLCDDAALATWFQTLFVEASQRLGVFPLSAHEAARGLVALRSIADTHRQFSAR